MNETDHQARMLAELLKRNNVKVARAVFDFIKITLDRHEAVVQFEGVHIPTNCFVETILVFPSNVENRHDDHSLQLIPWNDYFV